MSAFDSLSAEIRRCLSEKGFSPTGIQEKAIPEIASGKHTLVIAPTGTGKTESALLPILESIQNSRGINTLYITPLRALNRDMLSRIEWWAKKLGITVSVRHGDTSQSERTKQMKNPPQMLITTPETLQSILPAPKMGLHLAHVKHVVVDEVHELAEDKRGAHLMLALERLVEKAGEFQRIGLSATIGDPEATARFLFGTRKHAIASAEIERGLSLEVVCPKTTPEDSERAQRLSVNPGTAARLRVLKELVDSNGAVLTFVNTRETAEMLSSRFASMDRHMGIHHSSLSKDVRIVAEKAFKDGELKGLIATSSLELGIDIGRINLVVQYMSPRQVSRLVQRVGRSGHSISESPRGVVIATDPDDIIEAAVITRRALNKLLEKPRQHEKALDVLAHQLVGVALDKGRADVLKTLELLKRAGPYLNLTHDELTMVLRQLASERLIWLEGNDFGKRKASRLYYYTNLSMIPDERKFFVRDISAGHNVASLDEGFVASHLEPGAVFITRGMPWRVLDIGEKEVVVEPADDITAAIPAWEGEEIPVPYEIAQEVGELRGRIAGSLGTGQGPTGIASRYHMDGNAMYELTKAIAAQKKFFIPDENTTVLEWERNVAILHMCVGTLANDAIGKVLSTLMSSVLGETVGMKADAYRILFEFTDKARPDLIKTLIAQTKPENLEKLLEQSLVRTTLFRYKFMHVARRFGLIERGADYQRVSVRRVIDAVIDSPVYLETLRDIMTEKLDIVQARSVLTRLQKGTIRLVEHEGITPFGRRALERRMPELVMPLKPTAELVKILRDRTYAKTAKLFCTYCSAINYSKIAELPDKIKCPKCGSPMVAYIKQEKDSYELLKKRGKHPSGCRRLKPEEKRRLQEIERTSDLISAYGRKAVIALSGLGVGPDTAARLLGRMRLTEDELFKDMLMEQRNFLKTHRYWG